MHKRFFSIVVPAHNEEKLIGETLSYLAALQYPKDRYEVIVVENGSTDKTLEHARQYEGGNIKVVQSEKGVSRARNYGLTQSSKEMEWCLYLDADTFLKPGFLEELNNFLEHHPGVAFGTPQILSSVATYKSRLWYRYINVSDRLIRMVHAVHIVRSDLARKISYNEALKTGEDVQFARELAKQGAYFFMKSNNVINSARRVEQKGYLKMFFLNIRSGLPPWLLKHADWDVVR